MESEFMILSTTPNWLRTSLGRKSSAVKMYFLCHWHQCDLRPKCLLSVEFISYKVWCWTEALLMTLTAILLLVDDSVYCGWFEVSFEQVMLYRPCRLSCKQTVKHFMFIFSKPEGWVDRHKNLDDLHLSNDEIMWLNWWNMKIFLSALCSHPSCQLGLEKPLLYFAMHMYIHILKTHMKSSINTENYIRAIQNFISLWKTSVAKGTMSKKHLFFWWCLLKTSLRDRSTTRWGCP